MSVRVWAGLIAAVAIAGVVALLVAPTSNVGFTESASALAFITMVAIAIERLLELWWGIVGGKLGGWWPLIKVTTAMDEAEKNANALLTPLVGDVENLLKQERKRLEDAKEATDKVDAQLKALADERAKLKAQFDNAQKLAPGSARMALVTKVVADAAKAADSAAATAGKATEAVRDTIALAKQGTDLATTVVGAFSDNPARRLMSILMGASVGMVVAGFLGLNLFAAILEGESTIVSGVVGVILTGIVMGLGSSPTHEVIKAVQQYKESRKPEEMATGGEEVLRTRRSMRDESFSAGGSGEIPLRSSQ